MSSTEKSTKRERKKAAKAARARRVAREQRVARLRRAAIVAVAVIAIGAVVAWIGRPRPGEKFENQGRDHVSNISEFVYSTDPPTSGPHFDTPARANIYQQPISDGFLIHSLEHGHVVMSYNCTATPALAAEDCRTLEGDLAALARDLRLWKIIVVPRPTLEVRLALTAWQYLDTLDSFDEQRIRQFVRAHRDRGPEATET